MPGANSRRRAAPNWAIACGNWPSISAMVAQTMQPPHRRQRESNAHAHAQAHEDEDGSITRTRTKESASGCGALVAWARHMSSAPVLLANGTFYGTLAAVRSFGEAGIPVTLAEGHALAPARWSRYVTRRVRCPDVEDTEAFLAWLLAFGAASPGHVLLPTSDNLAWLYAQNHAALAVSFRMLPTPLSAVDALLDKRTLAEHCRAVGLGAPETWFPRSEQEAVVLGCEAGFPLLVKPRSQVFFASHMKGALVEDVGSLRAHFTEFLRRCSYGERLRRHTPDIVYPMLQHYYAGASEDIYGVSGYADGKGGLARCALHARSCSARGSSGSASASKRRTSIRRWRRRSARSRPAWATAASSRPS